MSENDCAVNFIYGTIVCKLKGVAICQGKGKGSIYYNEVHVKFEIAHTFILVIESSKQFSN